MDSNTGHGAELDQIQTTLSQLLDSRDRFERLEVRLEVMLSRWTRLEEQHTRALADLQHAAGRIQELERRLQQHVERLPHDGLIHENTNASDTDSRPPSDTPSAASTLRSLLDAFEHAEARLTVREEEFARWLSEARRDFHALTEALTLGAVPQPRSDLDPSPGVNRRTPSTWIAAAALIATITLVVYSLDLRGRTLESAARASAAEQQMLAFKEQATRELAAIRATLERETVTARESAAKASAMTDVLAAPDLIRFDLIGTPMAPRARGQGLWSRSRGLVFTASRLPSPPDGSVYQLWLVTPRAAVALGPVKRDSMGRVTLATGTVPNVTGRVVGLMLTNETQGEHSAPSGAVYLATPSSD